MLRNYLLTIFVLSFSISTIIAQEKRAEILLTKKLVDLPDREAVMLTLVYPPGTSSPKHRHNAHTFVYVLEGSVIMQVEGGEKQTLKAGDTFYETPEDVHVVSMNASKTEAAKILVYFIKKEGAPLSVPVP